MKFKSIPFKHQLEEWELSRSMPARAIFWEQGVGKTKLALDTAAWLYETKEIDGLLILCPNGLNDNWVLDEIPIHLSQDANGRAISYRTSSSKTKWHQAEIESLFAHNGLAILAMSYDAFRTKEGRKIAEVFVRKRRAMLVCDECQKCKCPSAKRTRAVVMFARKLKYRRVLSGTPILNSPFDVYSQIKALDEEFWRRAGLGSYEAFKTFYGIWEQQINFSTGGRFQRVVAFKNLKHLAELVAQISSRLTKEEVLDLPPKLYTTRYFALAPAQRKLYDELRNDLMARLDSGEVITTQLAIVQLIRLQQIASGFVPEDNCEVVHDLPDNARLATLLDVISDVEGQAIIWARFRRSVDKIVTALGKDAVRYDGAVNDDERLIARRRFQAGEVRFFVGNPEAGGLGLTLTAARTAVYFENSFKLEARLQSEDRCHRIGTTSSVLYVDLVGQDTIDSKIVKALRAKVNLAAVITGDSVRSWI